MVSLILVVSYCLIRYLTLSGKVLDFGCGAGVIGSVMALLNPDIELEMCDISALAVASSKAT